MADRDGKYIRVRNWTKFQHYRKRNPPWIRLYNELLDNYDFTRLQDASKWHAVGIWLLASRFDNQLPDDPAWIGQRISARTPVDIDALVSAGFVERYEDASKPLATRVQDATPEGEREGEREERRDREPDVAVEPEPPAREAPKAPDIDDGGRAEAIEEMGAEIRDAAKRLAERDRRAFMASARILVTGDDMTAWRDPKTGKAVPWPDRPQLFRVAIAKHEAGERQTLRMALELAIQQQRDPLPIRKSPAASAGSQAARVSNEYPRQSTDRGRTGPQLVPDPKPDPVEVEMHAVRAWESKHTRAEREAVMAQALSEVKADPTLAHLAVAGEKVLTGAVNARYRKIVLGMAA